jgi:AcrR family transcriptional regulator
MSGSRGRPRSTELHHGILTATCDLLTAVGYERLTIEAVAARAGVSKQTIYRWWASKSAIVAEAVLTGVIIGEQAVPADTGDLDSDVRSWLKELVGGFHDPRATALSRALAAASAESETDAARLYDLTVRPLRDALTERLQSAQSLGQLRADADLDAFAEAVMGAMLYRVLARSGPPPDSYADGLADLLLSGVRPR